MVEGVKGAEKTFKQYVSVKNVELTLPLENATIEETFSKIEQTTDFRFAYEKKDLNKKTRINNSSSVKKLSDILGEVSKVGKLKFKQINNCINVYRVRKDRDINKDIEVVISDVNVSGRVTSAADDSPLIGATVRVQGASLGTTTDVNGDFSLAIPGESAVLIFSYIGYNTQEVAVNQSNSNLNVALTENIQSLSDILVVGSRFNPRSSMSSPVPIDNITTEDLASTGQLTLDQMINYRVQSYNASQQTVSDATAHFNPADLRGLGPSRTLVLINGKRKNASSLVYINDTPGKGEVGVDMQSIPIGAIERVEVLRDGASAQYGSDAIAGVINIILKDDVDVTDVNLFSGITTEGDGFNYGFSANTGFSILEDGYVNVSTSFKDQERTNRAGEPGEDGLFGVDGSNPWIQENPDLGMIVGQPDMTTFDVFYNAGVPLKGNGKIYSFGGITYRNGTSFALYRTPYWVPDPNNIFHEPGSTYQGFHPTFETDIYDRTFGVGIKGEVNGWNVDLSSVSGSNTVEYNIGNTLNPDLGNNSPTRFFAGGYEFRNIVNNMDVFRKFGDVSVGFGSEYRTENFVAVAGEEASYTGGGAQSFPGIQPANEVDKTRYNIGFYTDLEYDDDVFLIGGAMRFEQYGDFGNTFNWKINSRVRLVDNKLTLRASANTGFRAPSLHQIYLSNVQTLISGGTVSNQGTFNNDSPVIRGLEVPKLKEEESFNFSAGLAVNPVENLEITLDYYSINIDDRVLFTGEIGFDGDNTTENAVERILNTFSVTSIKFFINAVDTKTTGVDFVATYKNIGLGSGNLDINFATNFNSTQIEGAIRTPAPIANAGNEIFNRKEQSRIVSARPRNKFLVGFNYGVGKFNTNLSFTRFGEVTWRHASDPANDQTFSAKVITDLNLSYKLSDQATFGLTVNNLFNVFPDAIETNGDVVTDLGGRFKYPWEVNQFGFLGTVVSGKLNFRF